MRTLIATLAFATLAACQTEAALFDPDSLKLTAEDDSASVTGWLRVRDGALTLYPTHAAFAAGDKTACIFIRPLSMAGIVPPAYDGKQMTAQGQLARDASAACPFTLTANDISAP